MHASIAALVDRWSRVRPRRRPIDESGTRYAASGERMTRYHDVDVEELELVDERAMWNVRPPSDEELERLDGGPRAELAGDVDTLAPRAPSRMVGGFVFTIFGLTFVLSVRRRRAK